ncbi:Hypothetical predicted protein, partial [Olea europaea subsp. europaea]
DSYNGVARETELSATPTITVRSERTAATLREKPCAATSSPICAEPPPLIYAKPTQRRYLCRATTIDLCRATRSNDARLLCACLRRQRFSSGNGGSCARGVEKRTEMRREMCAASASRDGTHRHAASGNLRQWAAMLELWPSGERNE